MKKLIYIFIFLFGAFVNAQTALTHNGNMQIHAGAQVGFHTSLINNAPFDQNLGLVGFYGSNFLNIQGNVSPVFYDFEIGADNGVALNVSASATNSLNFIYGDIYQLKTLQNIYFGLLGDTMYNGESDISKIDGYALITNQQAYSFPVGDQFQVRPLVLNSNSVNLSARCAYFYENPNATVSFSQVFDTNERERQLDLVNTQEFWRLEGNVPSTVTLSWNVRSAIENLTEKIENLLVVGWHKTKNEWSILGNAAVSGDAQNGIITSSTFIPDDYEVITIGSLLVPQDRLTIPDYYLSPNGDGINDALVIEELDLSPNNKVSIYDRFGLMVFQQENYTNEFSGFANIDKLVYKPEAGLPGGVYFYIVNMYDLGYEFQGFLYLAQ